MKTSILAVIFLLILSSLMNIACTKKDNDTYMNDAIITGDDYRMCACCGGLMITFNGETNPYVGDFKLISNFNELKITSHDIFPIRVKVDWKLDASATACVNKYIIITRLKRL